MGKDTHAMSFVKSLLYRIFGSLVTLSIAFIFTGNFPISAGISIVEVISKILLYYFYERAWIIMTKKYNEN